MRRRLSNALASTTMVGALGALSIPLSTLGFTFCPFAALTGTACPGCGLTRSVARLARGDLTGSVVMHPFGVLLAIQAAVFIAMSAAGFRFTRSIRTIPIVLGVNLVGLLAIWAIRLSTGSLPPI